MGGVALSRRGWHFSVTRRRDLMGRSAGLARRYGGDARLGNLLRAADSPYDPLGVRKLIAGVLAAPPGPEPDGWMALVAPRLSADLKAELQALADDIAAAR